MAGFITYSNANAVTITGTGAPGQSGALRFGNGTVWAAPIILNGNSTIYSYGGAANTTLNGAITGTGNLSLASAGGSTTHTAVWTLNAASTYNGSTVIRNNDGLLDMTVKLGVNDALSTTTSLNLEGTTAQATNTFTTLDLNGKNQALAGLTDTNSSSGAANVAFGKRVINSGSLLSTLTLDIASGTNTYGTTGTRVLAGTIGGTTAAGVAADNLALTKTGTGTLVLGGNNTYTGATTISAGTLEIGAGGRLGAGNYSQNITNNGTLIYSGTNAQTLSGIISGNGALTQNNTSTLTLDPGAGQSSSVGNFSVKNGAVLLKSGTLSVTTNNGLKVGGATVPAFTLDGGNLNTTGVAFIGGDAAGGRGTFTLTSGTWTNTVGFISIQFGTTGSSSVMNVNGGLVDSPRIQLGQAVATSTLNLNGGIVAVNDLFNTGSTSVLNLNGGILQAKSSSTNFMAFTGASSTVNVLAGGAIIDTKSFTNTISVPLLSGTANDGGLTKQGAGTLVLGGTNTYTGATTVSAGTLLVDTSANVASSKSIVNGGLLAVKGTAGSVTVNSGGSLGGSGTVGALTLNSGGLLNPGNSPGTLTAASAIVLGGSTYNWQITSLTGAAGTNWDLLSVTTLLDMSGVTSSSKWNLVVTGDSGFAGWTDTTSYSYVFAQAASVSGFSSTVGTDVTSLFNITTSGIASKPNASFTANGDFKVVVGSANGGTTTTLNLMAIPEPSTGSLLGFGLGGLVLTRLLRRKQS